MTDQTTPAELVGNAPTHSCDSCARRRAPVSRRALAGLLGVSAVGVPLLAACGSSDSASTPSSAAPASSAPASASAGTSTSTGGSAAGFAVTTDIEVGGGKIFSDAGVVVTQPTSGEFKAFSSTCTHAGCQVSKVADGTIECPCHGSMYSIIDGSVEGGPAPSPLPEVKITVIGDQISMA